MEAQTTRGTGGIFAVPVQRNLPAERPAPVRNCTERAVSAAASLGSPCGAAADSSAFSLRRVPRTNDPRRYINDRVSVVPFVGCWMWLGGLDKDGYGKAARNKRAHHAAYEAFVGQVPTGLQLDHLCNHPWCVNPDHLRPSTQRDNVLRSRGLTAQNARKTHCVNGHEFDELNTGYTQPPGRLPRRHCRACHRLIARRKAEARRLTKQGAA